MSQYNTLNERLKKQYEEVLLHQKYYSETTVRAVWESLNTYERFTKKQDFTQFHAEQAKEFKRWYINQTNSKGALLSLSTVRSTLKNLRDFFGWLALHPAYGKKIHAHMVGYLRLSDKQERAGRATRGRPSSTPEQYTLALEAMPHHTPMEKRDRALFAFAGITGMRDAAIISLKMKDVNLQAREVWQDPKHVNTKNSKAITTYFMPLNPLWMTVFEAWYRYAAEELQLPPDAPLFPKTLLAPSPTTNKFEPVGLSHEHWKNAQPVRNLFRKAFEAVGLPYFHPHSVRNMISRWAMEHCTQIEYKAISQNLGHDHAMTTYNSYGELPNEKRSQLIANLGNHSSTELSQATHEQLMKELQRRMQG